ncbi:MAG: hypothetical protein GY847_09110 [Proteobacteria bacterium]|nr:hypothetical protein [Pseudomonadota bacterium]
MPDENEQQHYDNPGERGEENIEFLGATTAGSLSGWPARAVEHAKDASADENAPRWKFIGPRNVGGAVRSIAQDPAVPTTFYGGAAQGGLWKSMDDGASWRPIGEPDLVYSIGAIAVAPTNHLVLYVGTGEPFYGGNGGNGLFKSNDGGETFDRLVANADESSSDGAAGNYGRIQVDPLDAERCWVASSKGLWRLEGSSFTEERLPTEASKIRVTDVAIVKDPTDPDDKIIILAGTNTGKVYRGVYTRGGSTEWGAAAVFTQANASRTRVAFSGKVGGTHRAYTVMSDTTVVGTSANNYPTAVRRSPDLGANWDALPAGVQRPGPDIPADAGGQAWYDLCIAVDPYNPQFVVVGQVDLWTSPDGGATFTKRLDWLNYDNRGSRAEHGDQHDILFDTRNTSTGPKRIWVTNDGGISLSSDTAATWRKMSYGITAAQFVDVTTHPQYPFIFGGGMQDNGTFLSYGDQTWYRLFGGDGGQIAFDPNNFRRYYASWQGNAPRPGLQVITNVAYTGAAVLGPPLPRTNSALLPDLDPPTNLMVPSSVDFPAIAHDQVFVGILAGHHTSTDRCLIGRKMAGYSYNSGAVTVLNTPAFHSTAAGDANDEHTSAVTFSASNNDLWVGTTDGRLFRLAGLPATDAAWPGPDAWTAVTLESAHAAGINKRISCIAVHPTNPEIIAVSTMGGDGRVYLAYSRTETDWTRISGTNGDSDALPRSPIISVVFHPTDPTVLFAATLAGVYVIRNLPARSAGDPIPDFTPEWKTYNNGLPLIQVNDLEIVPLTNNLRCATFGRGIFECNSQPLDPGSPRPFEIDSVRLSIRERVWDDSWTYPGANSIAEDPRVVTVPPTTFDPQKSFDIRVDGGLIKRFGVIPFGGTLDGAEFDETLRSDELLLGDKNYIYVQVHNRGCEPATNVKLHLYYSSAGNPVAVPPIHAGMNHPGDPTAGCPWQLTTPPLNIGLIQPGEPYVARIEWIPPLTINDNVALLGVVTNAEDTLDQPLTAATPAEDYVNSARQAGLRVAPVKKEVIYIRDGVEGRGSPTPGKVAWGGLSPDIIVSQDTSIADPDTEFTDLGDLHLAARVRPGVNQVYIRVHNRTELEVDTEVDLFAVPDSTPSPTSAWTRIDATKRVNKISSRGWKIVTMDWGTPADPVADPAPAKGFTLVAVARSLVTGTADQIDPFPYDDIANANVTDMEGFWKFVKTAPLANNVAFRSIRFKA